MIQASKHIIQKVSIDVSCHQEATGLVMHQQLGEYLSNQVIHDLSDDFDKLVPSGTVIRLDRLDLDLGDIKLANWQGDLKQKLLDQVRKQLEKAIKSTVYSAANTPNTQEDQGIVAQYIYFLKNGYFPWWATGKRLDLIEKALIEKGDSRVFRQLLEAIKTDQGTQNRFVLQASDLLFEAFSCFLMPALKPFLKAADLPRKLLLALSKTKNLELPSRVTEEQIRTAVRTTILEHLITDRLELDEMQREMKAWVSAISGSNKTLKPKDKSNEQSIDLKKSIGDKNPDTTFNEDGQYVTLAGLVLIYPFLQMFFQALTLLNDQNEFISETHREQAVQWLFYLGTGHTDCPENELTLCKILCDMPSNQPVNRWLVSTEQQKEEAESLLKALIGHWNALKNTSPDGLRQGFIHRSGHLSKKSDYWQLNVERLGQDILFDQLPWGFSVVKLPWMQERLMVEW